MPKLERLQKNEPIRACLAIREILITKDFSSCEFVWEIWNFCTRKFAANGSFHCPRGL